MPDYCRLPWCLDCKRQRRVCAEPTPTETTRPATRFTRRKYQGKTRLRPDLDADQGDVDRKVTVVTYGRSEGF